MTTPPDIPSDEPLRLQALRKLNLVETPLDDRFERVTRLAKRILGVDIAAIALVESDRQFFKSIQGLNASETSRDVSFCGHAILGDEMMVVPDATRDERFAENPLVTGDPNIVFYASMPLCSGDGYKLGTLCVIDSRARELSDEDEQHLRDLASMAELAMQSAAANVVQAALLEEVAVEQRKALIDPLTRLWNRNGILKLAREAVENAGESDAGLAVVMVDLDHFKNVNDTYGHGTGDEVLRVAARRMLAALRETDLIGRIGGDEFLCIVDPCENEASARQIAERVRSRLISAAIQTDAGDVSLSASLGVRYIPGGDSGELGELMDSADGAMYDCKRGGRNRVRCAGEGSAAA